MTQIDWSRALKKIERQFDQLPPEPPSVQIRVKREQERRVQEQRDRRSASLGAAARLLLVASLAAALTLWPYAHECGPGLFAYMGADGVVGVGGLWIVVTTWRHRMPKMHALGLLVVLGSAALIASSVLPRVGYAKVDASHPPTWWCGGDPAR